MKQVLSMPRRALAIGALLIPILLAACGSVDDGQQDSAGAPVGQASPQVIGDANRDDAAGERFNDGSGQGSPDTVVDRKVTRSATLHLRVDDIPTAVAQIEDLASVEGGFVAGSNITTGPEDSEGEQRGTITIRIPAEAYTRVIRQLRAIAGEVESESSQATEVTEEYTDLQSRLRNLEATEARYLALLERAQTVDEILAVQDRVNSTRLEIEQVLGRLNVLNDLVDLATVTVELSLPPLVERTDGKGWAEEALSTSWEATKDALMVLGTVAIASAFILPWIVIGGLVVGGAWRIFGRRLGNAVTRLYRM
jgi:hypothetical protein